MMREKVRMLISHVIKHEFGTAGTPDFTIIATESPSHGDYSSNIAFTAMRRFAVALGIHVGEATWMKKNLEHPKTPRDLADHIAQRLREKGTDLIERIEVAGSGFINFWVRNEVLVDELQKILERPDAWGKSDIGKGKTVMVEYFQLNIAKRPHIGHIRSAIIGDALKRMFASQGYRAVSDTHVGDWGTQFGILLLGYKEAGMSVKDKKVLADPFGVLEELYIKENEKIEMDPERRTLAKEEFAKLERGDTENRKIWEWMVDVSMKKLEESAERLGLLPFDEHKGESS